MRQRFFTWLARVTCQRALVVFLICVAVTVITGVLAERIRMDMTWSALVPENHPAKDTMERVIDQFGAATQIIVALEGPGKEELAEAAEALGEALQKLTFTVPAVGKGDTPRTYKVAKRVQVKYETEFIKNHGLMLVKAKDLNNQRKLYADYNLVPFLTHMNDILENEYVQNSDNLTKQEKEAVRTLDGMYDFVESLSPGSTNDEKTVQGSVDAMTIGDGYALSTDKEMLLLFITPTISLNDPFDIMVVMVNTIDKKVAEIVDNYPGITAGLTGGHVISRDEMEAGMADTARNVLIAFIVILMVFVISFRMLSGPLLAMIVLLAGITWDMGLAYLFIGRLNIMTAVCAVVLIGLGVDFAIHIISAYSEFRHKGFSIEDALYQSFSRIGGGLITGAVTTAFAFLSLLLTSYPAFREFGFVVGIGIITCLLASLFFLPSAIVLKEKIWKKIRGEREIKRLNMEFRFLGKIAEQVTRFSWVTVIVTICLTGFFMMFIGRVTMNENYMDMEPEGLESVRLQREIPKRFNISPDNMVAVTDSIEEANRLTDLLNERPAIGFVESITDYMPSMEKQNARAPIVRTIAHMQKKLPSLQPVNKDELMEQLYRFSDNLTEMSSMAFLSGLDKVFDKTNFFLGLDEEGEQKGVNRVEEVIKRIEDSENVAAYLAWYQDLFREFMKRRVSAMANSEPITMNMLPDSVRERFVSEDGTHFLVIMYSKKDIWDGLLTSSFLETITRDVPGASGMPVMMKAMVQTATEQGALALLYAFIAFFVILMIDFRSIKTTLIATLPLILTLIWMLGIMGLTGFPFSIINIIGLPLILGIGIDDGVHIIHRYKVEGRTNLSYTVSSIGKAIFLTTVTTLLGFGSLIPSTYRGYGSLGTLVVMGIGLCFLMSVVILPAILNIVWGREKKDTGFFHAGPPIGAAETRGG